MQFPTRCPRHTPSQPEQRYRSPQQKGAIPADAADDIYSLACIAFELLCGRSPDAQAHKAETRKPAYARHLNQQRWQALQNGLADARTQRGNDVRQWLAELDLSSAAIRLPSLSDLETELFGGDQVCYRTVGTRKHRRCGCTVVAGAWCCGRARFDAVEPIVQSTDQIDTASRIVDPPMQSIPAPMPATESSATGTISQLASDNERSHTNATQDLRPRDDAQATASGLPTVSFTQARYEISADAPVATLTIQRQGSAAKRMALQWFSIEGTAKSDIDYVRDGNTTVILQPGQRSANVIVPLIKGEPRDRALWFDIRIRATTDAMPGAAVVATVYLMPTLTNSPTP